MTMTPEHGTSPKATVRKFHTSKVKASNDPRRREKTFWDMYSKGIHPLTSKARIPHKLPSKEHPMPRVTNLG